MEDSIGNDVSRLTPWLEGADGDGPAAGGGAGLEVTPGVTDHPGGRQVQAQISGGGEEQAGRRLAALALGQIATIDHLERIGVMQAIVRACQRDSLTGQIRCQLPDDRLMIRLTHLALGNPGLIRDDNHQPAAVSQAPERAPDPGQQQQLAGAPRRPTQAGHLVEDPVAIQEDGLPAVGVQGCGCFVLNT